MDIINVILGTPLGYLMLFCYNLVSNYGVAIILFTALTRVILFPLNIWLQKNSIKMIKIQPEFNMIAVRFAGNRDKIAEEQLAYYKRVNYKPLAGVIPMLIQIPLILGLISVIYNPLQHLLHLDPNVISAFTSQAEAITGIADLGNSAQLKIVELIHNPTYADVFASLQVQGFDIPSIISEIQSFDFGFLGIDLSLTPSLATPNVLWAFPFVSGFSAFMLSFAQNKIHVLQKEQGWLGRWGMAIFLTLFSLFFAFIVPAGVGLYWIFSNVFSIVVLIIVNLMYPPRKYIDYDALEKSKIALAEIKEAEMAAKPTKEQMDRAKADYKRFLDIDNTKQLVFYSEKNGFYKYFRAVIEYILQNSDIKIHYITSDPNDNILNTDNPQIIPYYIDDNRLIVLFMKLDSDIVVMTTPDLQNFHLKRSYVRRDMEYIYMFHGVTSTNLAVRKGAYDHFDTIFCVGQHQIDELRECEKMYNLKEKNLVPTGYGLLDDLIESHGNEDVSENRIPQILIAPSHQEGNLLDTCIDDIMKSLLEKEYKIIIRPHPQYLKRNPGKIEKITAPYKHISPDRFVAETDFSSNDSIYTSDILITDWSGIAHEFSYTTKRPSLFINTEMKVLNPDYIKYENKPLDITLRDTIGISINPDEISTISERIEELLKNRNLYQQTISETIDKYVFNLGSSGEVMGQYIIRKIKEKRK